MKERKKKKAPKTITAEEFDKIFDEGKEDITPYLDLKSAKIDPPLQRINIDMPQEILAKVDYEANRIGVTRTSLIKIWISRFTDRLAH